MEKSAQTCVCRGAIMRLSKIMRQFHMVLILAVKNRTSAIFLSGFRSRFKINFVLFLIYTNFATPIWLIGFIWE